MIPAGMLHGKSAPAPAGRGGRIAPLAALADSVLGHAPLNKRPMLVAAQLENQFLRLGWPDGYNVGGEAGLAGRFGVGRDVIREVVRLLEGRNHARMRRGPHGGLVVVRPDFQDLAGRLCGYAYVSDLNRRHVLDAWILLQTAAVRLIEENGDEAALIPTLAATCGDGARAFGESLIRVSGSPLLVLLGDFIAPLLPAFLSARLPKSVESPLSRCTSGPALRACLDGVYQQTLMSWLEMSPGDRRIPPPIPPRSFYLKSQAMHVVQELMEATPPEAWARGHLIGNEFDLAERFGVDKSVVRQAIRLLEDAEVASSLPGRGRGLITRIPSTAPLSRLLCAYFVAQRIDEDDGERVFRALRVESAGRAADQVTSDDKAMLFALCHDLDVLVAPLPVALLQSFERAQQHATHNCLLGLCIDAIKAFLTWHMEDCPVASQRVLAAYRDHTKAVFAAICAGDRGAAITAEAAKFAAIQQTRFGHRAGGGRGRPKHLTRQ